jgi:hypothetical protein
MKKMYKVTYYIAGTTVASKWFKSMKLAAAFAITLGVFDVIEIKLFEDEGE